MPKGEPTKTGKAMLALSEDKSVVIAFVAIDHDGGLGTFVTGQAHNREIGRALRRLERAVTKWIDSPRRKARRG